MIAFSGNIEIGCVHTENTTVNTIHAIKKFAVTHQSNIMIFLQNDAEVKLSGALKSAVSDGSSHFNLQNHPNGIILAVYSVPFLSFHNLQIFGGIHTQNSNTLTPDFLAAVKCHNSCKITSIINIKIHITIDNITIFRTQKKYKTQRLYFL